MNPDPIIIVGPNGAGKDITKYPASGITNNAKLRATETIGNARYPLELFLRVVTLSLETNRIVNELPKLEIGGTSGERMS